MLKSNWAKKKNLLAHAKVLYSHLIVAVNG